MQDPDFPFKNLNVYCEINDVPMVVELPPGSDDLLMQALANISQGGIVIKPLKEGSKIEHYEEPVVIH